MHSLTASALPIVEEEEATGDVARIFAEIKHDLQIPVVPNYAKAMAVSPAALAISWDFQRSFYRHTTLPQSLTAMIHFTIAKSANCQYCSAGNEFTCRTLGVDEETLNALAEDLGKVSPQRLQSIIQFALKVSKDPQSLVAEDYDRVREQGVTDEELVEIILIAAIGKYNDILADTLKIEVEPMVAQALAR